MPLIRETTLITKLIGWPFKYHITKISKVNLDKMTAVKDDKMSVYTMTVDKMIAVNMTK